MSEVPSRKFLQKPDLESSLEETAKRLWGTRKNGRGIRPDHWSGLNLEQRAQQSGLLYEEAYNRLIGWLNWYVHGGASGTGGVSAVAFRSLELLCRDVIGRFVPEAYRRMGVAMHFHRAMPDFSIRLMELVKNVEVTTFQEFSDAHPPPN